jgi:hypothetical protein
MHILEEKSAFLYFETIPPLRLLTRMYRESEVARVSWYAVWLG